MRKCSMGGSSEKRDGPLGHISSTGNESTFPEGSSQKKKARGEERDALGL